jgi:hypothetical protein
MLSSALLLASRSVAQDVVVDEGLRTGSSATEIHGGTFTGDGWRIDDSNSRMFWDLGGQYENGWAEFTITGVTLEALGNENMHIFELFDEGGHWSAHRAVNIRVYGDGANNDAWDHGQIKLKCWDPNGAVEARTPNLSWDGSPHRFRVEWGSDHCAMWRDGELLLDLPTAGMDLRVGHLWLPLNDWIHDYSAPLGSSYTDLHLEGWEDVAPPDPPPDDEPDDGIRAIADVAAVAWAPAANFGYDPDLSVEGDGTALSAVSYLKFEVPPQEGDILQATLVLHSRDVPEANGDGGVIYDVPDASWTETGLTWDTRPALAAAIGAYPAVGPGDEVRVDVTAAVHEGFVALAIGSTLGDGAHFSAREDAGPTAPRLELVLGDAPDESPVDDPPTDEPPTDEPPVDDPPADDAAQDDDATEGPADAGCSGCAAGGGPGAVIGGWLAALVVLGFRRRGRT